MVVKAVTAPTSQASSSYGDTAQRDGHPQTAHAVNRLTRARVNPGLFLHALQTPAEATRPPPAPPHTTNSSGTPRSADTHSAGPANTGPRRTATEDKGRVRNNGTG